MRWSLSTGFGSSCGAFRFGGKVEEDGEAGLASPVIEERRSLI